MGKPKKDRKNRHDDEFGDDDVDLDPLANLGTSENQDTAAAPKQSRKERRKNKQKDVEDDEDVVSKMETLSMENEDMNGETTNPNPKKEKKGKKEPSPQEESDEEIDLASLAYAPSQPVRKTMTFDMLAALGDDNDMMQSDEEDSESEIRNKDTEKTKKAKEEVVLTPVEADNVPSHKKDKKKKKDKKVKEVKEEEADIDAILAALEQPKEKTGKKSKKEKKKMAEAEENSSEIQDTEMKDSAAADTGSETIPQTLVPTVVTMEDLDDEEDTKKKKNKAKKKEKAEEPKAEENEEEEDGEEGGTVKTAAQKKKEKKEREKKKKEQQRLQGKKKEGTPDMPDEERGEGEATQGDTQDADEAADKDVEDEEEGKSKKKKKKGKDEKETKKKGPSKQITALKEHLKKVQEEEERQRVEEDEKLQRLEDARLHREEQKRLEEEKKLRKKQKEKERTDRLKAEGKFLTAKQKQDKKRALQMLELMKAQGLDIPNKDDVPKKRPVYAKKKKTTQRQDSQEEPEKSPSPVEELEKEHSPEAPSGDEVVTGVEVTDEIVKGREVTDDEVKDSWDLSEEEEEISVQEEDTAKKVEVSVKAKETEEKEAKSKERRKSEGSKSEEDESSEESEDEGSSEEEESSEDSSEDDADLDSIERARVKIEKRKAEAERKRTTDVLRAPVVCVLGHVDTGKTKILDKLRRTNVQDGEAGGITQQIGATNVPKEAIRDKTVMCKEFHKAELKLPGLLIIDTPGHESFSNLRSRGSSLCDIAILVVDIMHGLEPQTIESINLLKSRKTPFIVALNKVDRLYQWKPNPNTDVVNTLRKQSQNTKLEFEQRTKEVIVQFAEQSLNAALFHENKNLREYVSMVPTSAHSGDGMGNLVALICELSQDLLAKRVSYSQELQATVMEVKAIHGLGTTIDVILVNGKIHEGETIVTAGTDGPIVTQIRGLLMPQPMKELRVKNQYEKHKEVLAAQGVKIIAKDLDKALAGLPLYVAHDADEVDFYKDEVARTLKAILSSIKLSERGVFVQASTLGSLEALLEFLRTSKIPYAGIGIGPVHKKDIMKASIMLEHDTQYAVILAFDIKIEREAQELSESLGVRVFAADIIYHLFDKFMAFRNELKKQRQDEFKHLAVFPTKLRILPQYIFNTRDPIVVGVIVEAGFVKEGTPLCVPSKEFVEIGHVTSVEFNHKQVEMARKGQEVCLKIEPTSGEAPKLYGRHFDYTDVLVSKISRQSIDTVKEYFRDDMTKPDWQLIVELKKMFQII